METLAKFSKFFRKSALLMLCLSLISGAACARTKVIVATESWAQVIYFDANQVPHGPMAEFIRKMNTVQDKFDFHIVIYPRLRLDKVFLAKQADVYPLRTVIWTDPALELLPTSTILVTGDVYIAKRANAYGGNKIFDDIGARTIAGVRGYHYHLFDNNPDETYIHKNFHAQLLEENEVVVKFVQLGRAEIGIVPEVVAAKYLDDTAVRSELIVGKTFDSRVELSNLVRKDGPISQQEMDEIVKLMVKSGDVDRLRKSLKLRE